MKSNEILNDSPERISGRTRILVVDDYAPFRRFVRLALGMNPGLEVVGEAADGLEAVRKAEQLQPDLILLDIGLPSLNGIEAARRIRKLSPQSRILFVSQESSVEAVQEALRIGALGYVVKTSAARELPVAVEAVCHGRRFLSGELSGIKFSSHTVQFFADDASLLRGWTRFAADALNAGDAVIVIATGFHRQNLLDKLQTNGVDMDLAIEESRYVSLDAEETLSTFMAGDLPDPARFLSVTGDLIKAATAAARGANPRVAACGECAPVLWAEGKPDAAVQLEYLWDGLAGTHSLDILCGYVLTDFQRNEQSHIYEKIRLGHSAIDGQ